MIVETEVKLTPKQLAEQYWVYDIPNSEMNQFLRHEVLDNAVYTWIGSDALVLSSGEVVSTGEKANQLYNSYVEQGYEGCVYRNLNGKYEFGKRSSGLIKRKPRLDAESIVVSVTQDKNGDGVLLCQAINGKQTGVQFECLMRKDADPEVNYRKYSNALLLIGKAITYQYEDIGEDTGNGRGKPQKPVGVALREMIGNEGRY